MTIKHIFFAALTAVLTASCANDDSANGSDNGQNEGKVKVTLTASTPETRVGMTKTSNNKATLYWQSGDNILVQTVTNSTYSGVKLTTANGTETGSKSATFTGEVTTDTELGTYAVYPYNESHKFTGEKTLTYNLPATYEYKTVESQIFSKTVGEETTYPSNSTNLPMLGTISDNKATFKLLGGMAVIRIDSMPAASGTLTVTADQQLSGNFTVADLSATDASIATSTTTSADSTVTFTFSGATVNSAGVFYLPLATGSYSDVKITISCDSKTQTIKYGNLCVARTSVIAISLYNHSGTVSKFSKIEGNVYTLNGLEFVDLGLPNGILWATTNVGAAKPADSGKFYAWGEVTAYGEKKDWGDYAVKTDYEWKTYKYGTSETVMTKYNSTDGKKYLEANDDAATVNCGPGCRMPTETEVGHLVKSSYNYTTCSYTTMTNSADSTVYGHKITSKSNSASIFLPFYGIRSGANPYKTNGYYWTNQYYTSTSSVIGRSWSLKQNGNSISPDTYQRFYGCTVRAVTEK